MRRIVASVLALGLLAAPVFAAEEASPPKSDTQNLASAKKPATHKTHHKRGKRSATAKTPTPPATK